MGERLCNMRFVSKRLAYFCTVSLFVGENSDWLLWLRYIPHLIVDVFLKEKS